MEYDDYLRSTEGYGAIRDPRQPRCRVCFAYLPEDWPAGKVAPLWWVCDQCFKRTMRRATEGRETQ